MTVLTRAAMFRRSARRSSRAMNCFIRAISAGSGGSLSRNSSVSRTAPSGRLIVSLMRLCSESEISQLPPPTSINRQCPPRGWLIAYHPGVNEPPFLKAGDDLHLPAGLIANPRQKSTRIPRIPHRRSRYGAYLVGAMLLHRAIEPLQRRQRISHRLRRDQPALKNTRAKPRHSRSSCNTFSRCCTTLAIFNRQEFDPISIAAYVCIS